MEKPWAGGSKSGYDEGRVTVDACRGSIFWDPLMQPLPPEVIAVFHHFRTAEFTNLAKDGTPITWPVTALYDEPSGTFITATSIGLPRRPFNIRRNPRVALLFSEPKASGLTGAPAVLVQGDAQAADDVTSVGGLEAL